MKKIVMTTVFWAVVIVLSGQSPSSVHSFREDQKKNPRVRTAYLEKEGTVKKLLAEHSIDAGNLKIFIRIFKKEGLLEMWASGKNESLFSLLKAYTICASSGNPGPKRKGGDGQVPEGFYHIEGFNPYSNFYLSLKVSYPNQSDKILGDKKNPGGDIFIHGNCVTIGCIPVTDEKIKEIYLLAVEAKNTGQSVIPVHIFPCKMDEEGMKYLANKYAGQPTKFSFWKNLEQGFTWFEKEKKIPVVSVNKDGTYAFRNE